MKIKKSQLKELIRQSLVEDWWSNLSSTDQAAYIKSHPKSQKAQDVKKKSEKPTYTHKGGDKLKSLKVKHPEKIPFDPDPPKKDDTEYDAGGPAYPNIPKGVKTSKQAKGIMKAKDLAKSAIPKDIDPERPSDEPEDDGNVYSEPNFDDSDFFTDKDAKYYEPEYDDSDFYEPEDDTEKNMMDASKKANKKMEMDVLNKDAEKGNGAQIDTEHNGTVTWSEGDPNQDTFFVTTPDGDEMEIGYDEIVRFHNDNDSIMKNLNLESNKPKIKTTVREVRQWMKTLEENRYKRTYMADCRRVSWLVNNNLSEDYETMPVSMKKKWSKAAYGRERQLATEFIKHLESKQITEQKLRKLIRTILIKETKLNEAKMVKLILPVKDRKKVVHILQKQLKLKITKDFEYGGKKGSNFVIELDKKLEDKVIELFMKSKIKVRG